MMEKLKAKKFLFLIIGAVFFVLWIGTGVMTANNGPEKTLQKLEKAMVKKDADLLVSCYHPDYQSVMKGLVTSELLSLDISNYEGLVISDITYSEDKKTAEVEAASIRKDDEKNVTSDFQTFQMEKVGSKWYIKK